MHAGDRDAVARAILRVVEPGLPAAPQLHSAAPAHAPEYPRAHVDADAAAARRGAALGLEAGVVNTRALRRLAVDAPLAGGAGSGRGDGGGGGGGGGGGSGGSADNSTIVDLLISLPVFAGTGGTATTTHGSRATSHGASLLLLGSDPRLLRDVVGLVRLKRVLPGAHAG
jgi:hypothetical protein